MLLMSQMQSINHKIVKEVEDIVTRKIIGDRYSSIPILHKRISNDSM